MIKFCVRLVQRWLPESFIFAILLTFVAAVVTMPVCHQTPLEIVEHWGGGVWNLLGFAMQMSLVLVCGSALAAAPAIKRGIDALARIPKSPAAAIALVTVVSALACWLNWGFGLIIGVVLTIFDVHNLVMVLLVIVAITVANTLMHPKKGAVTVDPSLLADNLESPTIQESQEKTPAQRLEYSPVLSWAIALLLAAYVVVKLGFRGGSLDLGTVIMIFLSLGLMLHGSPMAYVRAFGKATTGAAGIILQFPLYAGIMGIITGVGASGMSMGNVIADFCVNNSTPVTYPLITFFFAALLNMFVPSGGGHWAIQAPIMLPAGAALGVADGLTGTAIAWGDAWTNLIQPFWALPALAIAKLSARDIMGYCLVDLLITGVIICGGLVVWAL